MNETIYTIPINEAFDSLSGCPLCALQSELEEASVRYVMGAAMMEPDVRVRTNEAGFCRAHLEKMIKAGNSLSVALIVESLLPELEARLFNQTNRFGKYGADAKKLAAATAAETNSCFLCDRVNGFLDHYYRNILYLWGKETYFRDKLARQPFFCVPHLAGLLGHAALYLSKKEQAVFTDAVSKICRAYLSSLKGDVSAFCKSFDYRNAGVPLSNDVTSATSRAADFLTARSAN